MKQNVNLEDLITVQELADWLKVSKRTIQRRLHDGVDLPDSFKNGRQNYFPRDGVQFWLSTQPVKKAKARAQPTVQATGSAAAPFGLKKPTAKGSRSPRKAERDAALARAARSGVA